MAVKTCEYCGKTMIVATMGMETTGCYLSHVQVMCATCGHGTELKPPNEDLVRKKAAKLRSAWSNKDRTHTSCVHDWDHGLCTRCGLDVR